LLYSFDAVGSATGTASCLQETLLQQLKKVLVWGPGWTWSNCGQVGQLCKNQSLRVAAAVLVLI